MRVKLVVSGLSYRSFSGTSSYSRTLKYFVLLHKVINSQNLNKGGSRFFSCCSIIVPLKLKVNEVFSWHYTITWLWSSEALLSFAMSNIFYWHASQIEVFLEKPIHPHASRSTAKAWRQIPRNCQAISFYLSIKFFKFQSKILDNFRFLQVPKLQSGSYSFVLFMSLRCHNLSAHVFHVLSQTFLLKWHKCQSNDNKTKCEPLERSREWCDIYRTCQQ